MNIQYFTSIQYITLNCAKIVQADVNEETGILDINDAGLKRI